MSVSTYPATWPTEASFEPLSKALATAYNELEGLVGCLLSAIDGPDDTGWPDPAPTFETLGVLYNALDEIRTDIEGLTDKADTLERHLGTVAAIRRDAVLQKETSDAS